MPRFGGAFFVHQGAQRLFRYSSLWHRTRRAAHRTGGGYGDGSIQDTRRLRAGTDAFPPSIVGVETAVPAFIGYTEKAQQNGRSVALQPVRIASVAEYVSIFGGAFDYRFTIEQAATAAESDVKIGGEPYRLRPYQEFCFYNCLRLFFANGEAPATSCQQGLIRRGVGAASPRASMPCAISSGPPC